MTALTNSQYCKLITKDELTCLHVTHPHFFAEICLQGAQLTQFKHASLGDFVWLSPDAQYQLGKSLRGGIPICWPWFGELEKNPNAISEAVIHEKGAHGFARNKEWQIRTIDESNDQVIIDMSLTHDQHSLSIWPFEFELVCRMHLSNQLTIELINQNTGNKPFTISQALHTYFPVDNIEDFRVSGADQASYIDALDDWQIKQQIADIQFNQEVDRIYQGNLNYQWTSSEFLFDLKSNSHSSVVWNPWVNKSLTLSQFPATAYQTMMCIENGNILEDSVKLDAGESHNLTMTITKQRKD